MQMYWMIYVALTMLCFNPAAHGQPREARRHMARGTALFTTDPGAAAREFDQAFTLAPHEWSYLYNAGRAYEAAQTVPEAIARYQRYLREAANLSQGRHTEIIDRLTRLLATAPRPEVPHPIPESPTVVTNPVPPTPRVTPSPLPAVSVLPVTTRDPVILPRDHPPTTHPPRHRSFPLIPSLLIGTGVAAVGFGIFSGILAADARNEVANTTQWSADADLAYGRATNAETGMWISVGIASALLLSGVTWLALDY